MQVKKGKFEEFEAHVMADDAPAVVIMDRELIRALLKQRAVFVNAVIAWQEFRHSYSDALLHGDRSKGRIAERERLRQAHYLLDKAVLALSVD